MNALDAYIECALWSSNDDERDPEGYGCPMDENYGPEDMAPEAIASMRADLDAFMADNAADLALYCERLGYSDEQVGHDFWLTRNWHGTGFWNRYSGKDRELVDALKRLTDASQAYGESYLVTIGGQVHVS